MSAAAAVPVPVVRRFASVARARPWAPAVVAGDQRWDYATTARFAADLATRLRTHGIVAEDRVAVAGNRTLEMVGAVLGVLWSGAAYVPFDPADPDDRLRDLLRQAQVRVVVGPPELGRRLGDLRLISPGALTPPAGSVGSGSQPVPAAVPKEPAPPHPETLAYVIFTSGSTGSPKPVAVPHRALATLVDWSVNRYDVGPGDTFLQFARLTFDVSVWEILTPLCAGGTVVVATGEEVRSPAALETLIRRHRITHLDLPAPVLEAMRMADLPSLRFCAAGADVVPASTVRHVAAPGRTVINSYGPTEATEVTVLAVCDPADLAPPPIGRPVPGTTAHVLDERCQPVPPPGVGELFLGGVQLARGYLNEPGLTAQQFLPDPWGPPGSRLYRTGDRVRWRADGQLEFLGRQDRQVKIRGIRVEPAELEQALRDCPGVREAAVTTASGRAPRLIAHVVGTVETDELREQLTRKLPTHLRPAAVVRHTALPRTPEGKLDNRALVAAEPDRTSTGAAGDEDTPLVVRLVSEVAGITPTPTQSLLAAGGDSLDAIRVVGRLRAAGFDLDVGQLLGPTPVADLRPARAKPDPTPALAPGGPDGTDGPPELTLNQRAMWYHQLLFPTSTAYHVPMWLELAGPLDVTRLQAAWDRVVARHDALRTRIVRQGVSTVLSVDATPPPLTTSTAPFAQSEATPFALSETVPVRCQLVRRSPTDHALVLTTHHLICDGWSLGVLVEDLADTYRRLGDRSGPSEPVEPAASFESFVRWQNAAVAAGQFAEGAHYLQRLLRGRPTSFADRHGRRPTGDAIGRIIDVDRTVTAAIRQRVRTLGTTVFVGLLAGFARALAQWSHEHRLVLGVTYANRPGQHWERTIGQFVNTSPVPIDVDDTPEPTELINRVRQVVTDTLPYWQVPLPLVTGGLDSTARGRVGGPWHALFEYDNAPIGRFAAGAVRGALSEDGLQQGAVSELSLRVFPRAAGGLRAVLVADSGVYQADDLAEVAQLTTTAWCDLAQPSAEPGAATTQPLTGTTQGVDT